MEQTEIDAYDLYHKYEREQRQESRDGPLFQASEKAAGKAQADQLRQLEQVELHIPELRLNASELPHGWPVLKTSRQGKVFIQATDHLFELCAFRL